jgi:opacity protein-like surface antigen
VIPLSGSDISVPMSQPGHAADRLRRRLMPIGWGTRYYTEWNWTSVSLFGKFVWAPREEISPYFTAGVGAYVPRTRDKWYDNPDTIHTYTSRGERHFGIHLGVGVHYFLSRRAMVFLEFPISFIHAKNFIVNEYESSPRLYHDSQILNLFAGINFLFGLGKKETKDDF